MRILLKKDIAEDTINALIAGARQIPGYRGVVVTRHEYYDRVTGKSSATGWVSLSVTATEKAQDKIRNMVQDAKLAESDPNANHDHAACIEGARKLGVPAAYAHTPETYLSS